MLPQQYCLRWKYHHSNLQTMFSQLLERQAFCDVTLACEGRTIKAHKVVLSACSTYFDTILSQYEEKDPILIMKDVKFVDIKCLVEFMYKGEINVDHCHLATLLKTAEELRIKGLAEVSWRDDESCNESGLNGIQSVLPQVSTVMDTGSDQEPPNKRKRGRPPIDDYDQPQGGYGASKMGSLSGSNDPYQPEVVIPDDDVADWDDDQQHSTNESVADENEIGVKSNTDNEQYGKENGSDYTNANEQGDSQNPTSSAPANTSTSTTTTPSGNNQTSNLSVLEAQWPDVIKMNDYLNTGRRQQFWEEPFTRRVMEAIKSKELEMKCAAELLGVSYGTLYGRYRDAYGCLKHPYRVRDFWNESGQSDILGKLQRKEITLFRAAEQLNVTPQTLSNYLITLNGGDLDASTSYSNDVSRDGDDSDDNSDSNHILPDSPSPLVSIKPRDTSSLTQSVLQNHPDITIIKKEKVPMKDTTVTTVPTISSKPSNHSDDSSSSHYEGE